MFEVQPSSSFEPGGDLIEINIVLKILSGEYNWAAEHSTRTTVKDMARSHESLPQHYMCIITWMAAASRLNHYKYKLGNNLKNI